MINKFEEMKVEETNSVGKAINVLAGISLIDKILGKINALIGRNYITQIELKNFLLSGDIVELWGSKLDGTPLHREFYKNMEGPGGRAMMKVRYWDSPYNYMILYSKTDSDFRTIVLRNVTKVKINGKIYKVK